jgi:hypothetical protein
LEFLVRFLWSDGVLKMTTLDLHTLRVTESNFSYFSKRVT